MEISRGICRSNDCRLLRNYLKWKFHGGFAGATTAGTRPVSKEQEKKIMIETSGLSKQFPNETAIDYKDMIFETGKSYMLLGASGCGKSTLLNMLAGVMSPTRGTIRIDGTEMTGLSQKKRDLFRIRNIGYIFQDFKLIEEMTVMDNINILKMEGVDTSHAAETLEKLGISGQKNKKVRYLSGGQKQRVAIARAIVKSPQIILADEPTGNLNYAIGRQVIKELIAMASGKTLITVTHDDRLSVYFDKVIDMNLITGGQYDIDGSSQIVITR